VVGDVDPDRLEEVCEIHGVQVLAENPASALATALPNITALEPRLVRRPVPASRRIERWDTASASWIETDHLHAVGAYRISNFSRVYCVRTPADIENGNIAIGNVQVVKHIANAWAGDALLGYHAATNSLLVPRGADLPGLYARAAVIPSGQVPTVTKAGLQYRDVRQPLADILYTRLSA
jgi:hypothetical protein